MPRLSAVGISGLQAGEDVNIDSVRHLPGLMQLTLRYPNLEVRSSLNNALLEVLSDDPARQGVHLPLVPEGKALQQLRDRAYADKYRARGEPIHLIGVEFSKDQRSVIGFEVGKA